MSKLVKVFPGNSPAFDGSHFWLMTSKMSVASNWALNHTIHRRSIKERLLFKTSEVDRTFFQATKKQKGISP